MSHPVEYFIQFYLHVVLFLGLLDRGHPGAVVQPQRDHPGERLVDVAAAVDQRVSERPAHRCSAKFMFI